MNLRIMNRIVTVFTSLFIVSATTYAFDLKSADLKANGKIAEDFVYQGMGCNGKNMSPELHWAGAPKETKSFALTVYDPKAPTGSGWWHWIVVNIPATTTSLKKDWKAEPATGLGIANDFGTATYGGPCPPPGAPHPYIFTVHALKTDKVDVPAGASNAYARFMIEAATIKKASFTSFYGR